MKSVGRASERQSRLEKATPLLFFVAVAGVLLNFPSVFSRLGAVFQRYLWEPVAWILLMPLVGLWFIALPVAGVASFNGRDKESRPLHTTISCVILSALYLTGNSLHFHRGQ